MTKVLMSKLFMRYNLAEGGYKKKYRSFKPGASWSSKQFAERLRIYFKKWMGLAKLDNTKKSLVCLLVKEKFMDSVSLDLATNLKERNLHR